MPEVLLTAWGNASRTDDALGPNLLHLLETWASSVGIAQYFEWVEDFQLQIEHALYLEGKTLALYVDASQNISAPFSFSLLSPLQQPWHTTHAMPPESVLAVSQLLSHSPPCPAFLLCLKGENFNIGEGLSPSAQCHLQATLPFAQRLLQNPSPNAWLTFCRP